MTSIFALLILSRLKRCLKFDLKGFILMTSRYENPMSVSDWFPINCQSATIYEFLKSYVISMRRLYWKLSTRRLATGRFFDSYMRPQDTEGAHGLKKQNGGAFRVYSIRGLSALRALTRTSRNRAAKIAWCYITFLLIFYWNNSINITNKRATLSKSNLL